MIEKLRTLDDIPTNTQLEKNILTLCSIYTNKINELCDIINTIQKEREAEWFEIKEWIDILEAVRKSVNTHEKQIDKLQMKIEPEKCEVPAENVLTKSLRMDKEFAEEEIERLQDELDRTKKQLGIANDTLRHADWFFNGDYNVYAKDMRKEIKYAIKAISDIADYGQPIAKGGGNE